MNDKNPKVDGYLRKNKRWLPELEALRSIILESPLTEDVKWRVPCYTSQAHNVVFLGAFKEYCSLSFIKGVLLKDPRGILQKPGENTQSSRLVRFTSVQEIEKLKSVLTAYILEAIEIENAGLKVTLKKITDRKVPDELETKFTELPSLKTAFHALTPGRQRAYFLHFSTAKQSTTRTSRVEKCVRRILDGKGLDD